MEVALILSIVAFILMLIPIVPWVGGLFNQWIQPNKQSTTSQNIDSGMWLVVIAPLVSACLWMLIYGAVT